MNKFRFLAIICLGVLTLQLYGQREQIQLDGTWDFAVDSLKIGIKKSWYKSGIPTNLKNQVVVPHTWNMQEKLARYWGWGWYQRDIEIPANVQQKNIRLQFNAVYHDATIWVNDIKAGEHKGSGFTKFFVDITSLVKPGTKNRITVLADNSFSNTNIPYQNSFDWPNDGGIIRSVYLLSTGYPHINNVRITPSATEGSDSPKGTAMVELNLLGEANIDLSKISLKVSVTEDNQSTSNVIYAGSPALLLKSGIVHFNLQFDSVNLWHFNDPNLYRMDIKVYKNDNPVDNYSSIFGFRNFTTRGYQFVFNGEAIRTAGIESMPGSSLVNGMAETQEELLSYLEKLQYLNSTFTRFHWQQDDFILEWCSRNGIMVQEEIPIWGHRTFMTDTIIDIAKSQIKEMITDHYNYPCIVAWGVGNEIAARKDINIQGVKTLYAYTKSLDSTRLVNYVSNTLQQARHWLPKGTPADASAHGDVLMLNDYHSTWYRQSQAGMGANLDTIKVENPEMPLVISEFGLCEPENWGDDQRRIFDMIYSYGVYESKPSVGGVIYFCINDYRTHMGGGLHGFHTCRVHGVYDLEGNPKPSAAILRQLHSPVEISGINRNREDKIDMAIVSNSGFPSYTLKGFKVYWSENIENYKSGDFTTIPDLKPGALHGVKFENKFKNRGVLTIENKRGVIVYQQDIDSVDPYF